LAFRFVMAGGARGVGLGVKKNPFIK